MMWTTAGKLCQPSCYRFRHRLGNQIKIILWKRNKQIVDDSFYEDVCYQLYDCHKMLPYLIDLPAMYPLSIDEITFMPILLDDKSYLILTLFYLGHMSL